MSGPGKVNYASLLRDSLLREPRAARAAAAGVPIEALETERKLIALMLTHEERRRLAELAPETAWVMD